MQRALAALLGSVVCLGRTEPQAVREHQVFLGNVDCRVSKETAALTVVTVVLDRSGLQANVVNRGLSVLRVSMACQVPKANGGTLACPANVVFEAKKAMTGLAYI